MKKIFCLILSCFTSLALFAQIANDGFRVPLEEDLTNAISETSSTSAAAPAGKMANVLQGLWIEAGNETTSLIRDIATGEKKGYELDNNRFFSEANWWFWGDINKYFHLDAEISVWSFDKKLYQANSFAANVPSVSVGDGVQTLLDMLFNPLNSGNENGVGTFNKMALNLGTPYANFKFGYGGVKDNGMAHFDGIYTVIDRWEDVGKGFTEITNGKELQNFGNLSLYALAGFSRMRGTYGLYDVLDMRFAEKFRLALTFGSMTNQEELFMYNKENSNAFSTYLSYSLNDSWKFELHGLSSFNQNFDLAFDSSALAGRVNFAGDNINLSLMQSFAGENVNSVWGSDGQNYDDIGANKANTQIDFEWITSDFLTFVLDEALSFDDLSEISNSLMTLRTQAIFDFDLSSILSKDITVSTYGVFNLDKLATTTSVNREIIPYFNEFGLEASFVSVIPGVKKLLADYAILMEYDAWKEGNKYDLALQYHSIMLNADISDNFNVHAGSVIRIKSEEDATFVPLGFAFGCKNNNLPLPGKPSLWVHFCYGMNPYSDDNFSLYRADNSSNKAVHRTYLLNDLYKDYTTSSFGVGLIWNL